MRTKQTIIYGLVFAKAMHNTVQKQPYNKQYSQSKGILKYFNVQQKHMTRTRITLFIDKDFPSGSVYGKYVYSLV